MFLIGRLHIGLLAPALMLLATWASASVGWCQMNAGNVSGFAEWSYADYSADDVEADYEASHFSQKYSLTYENSGLLMAGRLGHYRVSVGSEWTALNADVDGQEISEDRFKPLYNGELVIAPGALPFRFKAYSYDSTSTFFVDDAYLPGEDYLIFPRIRTGLNNGQYIVSGATLLAGIRNGSYLGEYRELLSQFPKLLMDYQDIYQRDLKRDDPVDTRLRKLAFVSLNKKDNWFHYRFTEFKDYEDETQDWTETQYLLGTIDHLLRRQWINLTNWIKISADGSYTESDSPYDDALRKSETYQVNFFALARHDRWKVENFTNYTRQRERAGRLEQKLEIPLYAGLAINPATYLRANLLVDRYREDQQKNDLQFAYDTYYGASRLTTFKTRKHVFEPYVELEYTDEAKNYVGSGQAGRLGFQLASNSNYRKGLSYLIDYNIAYVEKDIGEKNYEYVENVLTLSGERAWRHNIRTGLTQEFIAGFGDVAQGGLRIIGTRGEAALPSTRGEFLDFEDHVYHSITEGYVEHRQGRLFNRVMASFDYIQRGNELSGQDDVMEYRVEHRLDYQRKHLRLSSTNTYLHSDAPQDNLPGSNDQIIVNSSFDSTQFFNHFSEINYRPSRVWESGAYFNLTWDDGRSGSSTKYRLAQRLKYTFFTANGIIRRLAEVQEKFTYECYDRFDGETFSGSESYLGFNYYPYRVLTLSADIRYRTREWQNDIVAGLHAAVDFPKLQMYFDYRYGARPESGSGRTEHRWELGMRKYL